MGTRNLTMVINKEGETKVAQYGQWDGYPEGQGKNALDFLLTVNLEEFYEKVNSCHFYKDGDVPENASIQQYPQLSRDHGACILEYINNSTTPVGLIDNSTYGNDSSCEWAYIVNFQTNTFEIYTCHDSLKDKSTLKSNRWTECGLIDFYSLYKLPTIEEFMQNFNVENDDNEDIKTESGFIKRQKQLKKIVTRGSKLERIANGIL